MATMMNNQRSTPGVCPGGIDCCGSDYGRHKKAIRKVIRVREKREWRKEYGI